MTVTLAGIRVLDLARYLAGPMAAALLADLGADVIRIEPPGGAEDRAPLPLAEGFHGGAGFTQTGRNKRGLSLDLGNIEGRGIFERLVATADVVIANLPPSAVAALRIDYNQLRAIKPDIIFLHVTAFGAEGPYANRVGFDAIAQVMCGMTYMTGEEGKPTKSAAAWVDMSTGFLGAYGVMAALRHRDRTGEGQKVEADLFTTALTVGNYFLIEEAVTKAGRVGTGNRAPSGGPADLVATADGWIYVASLGNAMFGRLMRLIGHEALIDDVRFATDNARAEHGELLSAVVGKWSSDQPTDAALAALADARIPAGRVMSHRRVLEDPHVLSECLQRIDVPELAAGIPYVRSPVRFSACRTTIAKGPPKAGADSDAILESIGYSPSQIVAFRQGGII